MPFRVRTSRYLPCTPLSPGVLWLIFMSCPFTDREHLCSCSASMGVPWPWVSPPVGHPAFAPMKRSVRVGPLLFLLRLLACHSLERAFHIRLQLMCIPASSLEVWCDGYGRYRTELRFDSPSLTMRTGLAERRYTYLLPSSALWTCCCPLWVSPPSKSSS
jgi:hypothetical protein